METTHLASWQKDREDWLRAGFHLLVASPAETTQDASWQKDREDWLGAGFHLLVASPTETTQDASSPLNVLPHFRLWGIFGVRGC